MSKDELNENLGTIARSGTNTFIEAIKNKKNDISAIGYINYNFKDLIYPHLNFNKINNQPLLWFAKPEKIIFCGSTPASIALSSSPTDTTSAPAPKEAISLMID